MNSGNAVTDHWSLSVLLHQNIEDMETRVNFMGAEETPAEISVTETLKIDKEQFPKGNDILDIHTHHTAPQPRGVISLRIGGENTLPEIEEGQAYSAGIHPWDTVQEPTGQDWEHLEAVATLPQVVAIGEAGVDLNLAGVPMFRQLQVFKRHIELSERLGKPLVIHNVKGADIVVGLRKDLKPKQNWAVHGFRGKPQVAQMLIRAGGCYLSFGESFNTETLKDMPEDRILAETDESELDIEEVIARLSAAAGKDLKPVIAANTAAFLKRQ